MNSRVNILAAIKESKPQEVPLPIFHFEGKNSNGVEDFIATLTSIGGQCKVVDDYEAINLHVLEQKQQGKFIVQGVTNVVAYNVDDYKTAEAGAIELVDLVFLEGGIAVAENGAVWMPEENMVNRLLPFLCQHLVLVIDEKNIVSTMHDAYTKIKVDEDGFGVFVAGPSKTADIEQSLVIGAHGPLSLMVYIISQKD